MMFFQESVAIGYFDTGYEYRFVDVIIESVLVTLARK
jgi:hypothetical protein